nr:hypothetical protein [uncultured Desulfobulbus sp.]
MSRIVKSVTYEARNVVFVAFYENDNVIEEKHETDELTVIVLSPGGQAVRSSVRETYKRDIFFPGLISAAAVHSWRFVEYHLRRKGSGGEHKKLSGGIIPEKARCEILPFPVVRKSY